MLMCIKFLGAYLGAWLSQVSRVRHLNKRLKVLYKIGPGLSPDTQVSLLTLLATVIIADLDLIFVKNVR